MILLVAPYGRNEVTAAALRLAELCWQRGAEVQWVAPGRVEAHISPSWDSRVRSVSWTVRRAVRQPQAVAKIEAAIYLAPPGPLLDMVELLAPAAKRILVPSWSMFRLETMRQLVKYHAVACPSRACLAALQSLDLPMKVARSLSYCLWCAGHVPGRRAGLIAPGQVHLCICCDHTIMDRYAQRVLEIVTTLLAARPHLHITVLAYKSWSRRLRRQWRTLCQRWGIRLTCQQAQGTMACMQLFHQHDSVAILATHADFGMTVVQAQAAGAATIAWDEPPFRELIQHGRSGFLIHSETVFDNAPFTAGCTRATEPQTILTLQARDWRTAERAQAFAAYWSNMLWGA